MPKATLQLSPGLRRGVVGHARAHRASTLAILGIVAAVIVGATAVATAGPATGETIPTGAIRAESFSDQHGAQLEATGDVGGGRNVGWLANGDWMRYNGVSLGQPGSLTTSVRVAAAANDGGAVELRMDSLSGQVIASISIQATGGWQVWVTKSDTRPSPGGVHDVFLVIKNSHPWDFVNINWFAFGLPGEPVPPAPTVQPTHSGPTGPSSGPVPTSGPVSSSGPAPGSTGFVLADPQVTGVVPSMADPPPAVHREFQANCSFTHRAPDDPIVFPALSGASHDHTFLGNPSVNAFTTTQSLLAATSACTVPADRSGYWMPTMYNGPTPVVPNFPQVIYYKSGVKDYTSVRPFPTGLRYVVGSPTATADEFGNASEEGWECGDSYGNKDFPAHCPSGTQLNVRFQAPSCWDGKHLDSPNHKSHMAYPVSDRCPMSHPVAVPMVEFKIAYPVSGDMSQLHLSSGRGYSWHYDFFNAWEPRTLDALVKHCINGGLQCNARGFDEFHPHLGAALNERYELP